jgi:hypothetical protein
VSPIIRLRESINLPSSSGVYWLIVWNDATGRPHCINRLIHSDPYGILYIGSATSLRSRAGTLASDLLSNDGSMPWSRKCHSVLYDYYHTRGLSEVFPLNTLRLAYHATSSPEEAVMLEQASIIKYRNRHGDRPPFNREVPYNRLADYKAQIGPLSEVQLGNLPYWPPCISSTLR